MPRIAAERATTEVAADELLDVGVRLFDPNVPEDEKEREKERIYPEVRKAESRYIPMLIRDTLEDTGQWGQVRMLPRDGTGMEVFIDGRIVRSDGRELVLDVTVSDAAGRTWFRKTYEGDADTRAYKDVVAKPRDPFENVYNTLANDLLAARRALTREQRVELRRVADMRFASDLAPYAFGSYLAKDKRGLYSVTRLPADDDPVVQRMQRVRERDYALVDTLNEHYANFGSGMAAPYGRALHRVAQVHPRGTRGGGTGEARGTDAPGPRRRGRGRRHHGGGRDQQQRGICGGHCGRHRRHVRLQERPRQACRGPDPH